ncbi:hypothetical protein AYI69_g4042 [Smittium culicis]|uniref:Uncharacterized protein n=1 Tax=Smittium culicis TaxID=133412 RepID=A0A1R1YH56_9FUNG|nr:hypothetical protein AYI69_g4042 [Smittium culicis]
MKLNFTILSKTALFLGTLSTLAVNVVNAACLRDFNDITINQATTTVVKNWQLDRAVKIPCSGNIFSVEFTTSLDSDIFFMISNSNQPESGVGVSGTAGARTQRSFLAEEINFSPVSALAATVGSTLKFSIKLDETGIFLYKNDEEVSFLISEDFDYDGFISTGEYYIFFAAENAGTTLTGVNVDCTTGFLCNLVPDTCPNSSTFSDRTVSSIQTTMDFASNDPIVLPCGTSNFEISMTVNTDGDFYVGLTDSDGAYGNQGVIQLLAGVVSNKYSTTRGRYYQVKRSTFNKRAQDYNINVKVLNNVVTMSVNGALRIQYTKRNFNVSQFYVVPYTGSSNVSNGKITCDSIPTC